jgi:hypothetical protein
MPKCFINLEIATPGIPTSVTEPGIQKYVKELSITVERNCF